MKHLGEAIQVLCMTITRNKNNSKMQSSQPQLYFEYINELHIQAARLSKTLYLSEVQLQATILGRRHNKQADTRTRMTLER